MVAHQNRHPGAITVIPAKAGTYTPYPMDSGRHRNDEQIPPLPQGEGPGVRASP